MRRLKQRLLHSGRRERGQALVEFGLVSLVFFGLVFAIFDFARVFQAWNSVQHASREAARYAITGRVTCTAYPDDPLIDTENFRAECIEWTAKSATSGLNGGGVDSTDLRVAVTTKAWDYLGATGWKATADEGNRGKECDQVQVRVKYTQHFVTPILAGLVPGGIELNGYQRMTNEPFASCDPGGGAGDGTNGP